MIIIEQPNILPKFYIIINFLSIQINKNMEPRKFILPNLSKLSSSSGSIGNLGSSRGMDFSPAKTFQDYSSVDTRKMEQTTFKDSNEVTTKQEIDPM